MLTRWKKFLHTASRRIAEPLRILAYYVAYFPKRRSAGSTRLLDFAVLGPPRLCGAAHGFAALLCTDVTPAGGAQAKREASRRRWSQLFRRDINEFQGEIEYDFRRQPRIAHHGLKALAASRAECASEISAQFEEGWI